MVAEYSLRQLSFAKKLNHMMGPSGANGKRLKCVERFGPDGFRIVDLEKFERDVLPKYFKTEKLSSFKRQLNIYDFERIPDSSNTYRHKHFIVGDYERIQLIVRNKDKTKGKNSPSKPSGVKRSAPYILDEELTSGLLDGGLSGDESDCSFKSNESYSNESYPLSGPQMGFKKRAKVGVYRFKYTEKSYAELKADVHLREKDMRYEPRSNTLVFKDEKTGVSVCPRLIKDEKTGASVCPPQILTQRNNSFSRAFDEDDFGLDLNNEEQSSSPLNNIAPFPIPAIPSDTFDNQSQLDIYPPMDVKKFSFPDLQPVKAENSLSAVDLNNGAVIGTGFVSSRDPDVDTWLAQTI